MAKSINSWELREADVLVRPALVGVGSADFTSRRRAVEAGRTAMQAVLPKLQAAIEAKSK
jgi:NTE family protein